MGLVAINLISRELAVETIGDDRLRLLTECHRAGWANWLKIRATEQGADLSSSARARIVHDGAVAHAKASFPESMCGQRHGLLVLDFELLMARFKLLHADLTPRGIPTGQAVLFEQQAQTGQLTIWPMQPMLIVGYLLDALGTTITRQVLVLRRDGQVMWEHDLPATAEDMGGAPVTILPASPQPPAPADVRSTRPEVEVEKKGTTE
jgi:hypothetical protein